MLILSSYGYRGSKRYTPNIVPFFQGYGSAPATCEFFNGIFNVKMPRCKFFFDKSIASEEILIKEKKLRDFCQRLQSSNFCKVIEYCISSILKRIGYAPLFFSHFTVLKLLSKIDKDCEDFEIRLKKCVIIKFLDNDFISHSYFFLSCT